jgi:2-desacetyl-2-hydroxyethyl bacteriochlorophyllide A dehydrogenase
VVGLLITQLLERTGVSQLTVVDPISHRRDLALRVGANEAVDPRELSPGQDFDVAIEVSGNVAALDQAVSSVAFGGTVIVASWYGTKSVPLQLGGPFHRRRLRLVSSQVSTIDAALQPRWSYSRRLSVARDLLPHLQLASLISHRFPVQAAAEAYRLVDEHPDTTVQVIFTY